MAEVPDLLVTARFALRTLANGEAPAVSAEAKHVIGEACDLLDQALANVLEVTRNLPDLATLDSLLAADRIAASCPPVIDDGAASRQ